MTAAPPPLPPPAPSWFSRNWFWVVPAAALAVALVAGLLLLGFWGMGRIMKESDVYADAMVRVRASAAVQEKLGTPIAEGWMVNGNVMIRGNPEAGTQRSEAVLVIPISGPKAKALVRVEAVADAGVLTYEQLLVEVASTPPATIDVRPAAPGR